MSAKVVIVGAGPTGMTLALLLARQGISVTLLEASKNFQRLFRGEALMPSGLEAIEHMGLQELLAPLPQRPLTAWEFSIEGRTLFRAPEPLTPNDPPCTLISQPAFLDALLAQAQTYPQFQFISGQVRDLLWHHQRVEGVVLGENSTIGADLVIGADGRKSLLRDRAHLALVEQDPGFDILWFQFPAPTDIPDSFHSVVRGHSAYGWFKGVAGQLQLGWPWYRDTPTPDLDRDWQAVLAAAADPPLAAHLKSLDHLPRPQWVPTMVGRCPRWYQPGLLLLGDAAHPLSPIRAQGINMGLRDSLVAARYLSPLATSNHPEEIDRFLPLIQAAREPEIITIQRLQQEEMAQAQLLRHYPLLRQAVSRLAPVLGPIIRRRWLDRQGQLRRGLPLALP